MNFTQTEMQIRKEHKIKFKKVMQEFNFKTQKELTNHLSNTLQSTIPGTIIEHDHNLLCELLKIHYEQHSYVPLYFATEKHPIYKTQCYMFYDTNKNKLVNFRYMSCINNYEQIIKFKQNSAFRNTIKHQIVDFKNVCFQTNQDFFARKQTFNYSMIVILM